VIKVHNKKLLRFKQKMLKKIYISFYIIGQNVADGQVCPSYFTTLYLVVIQ